MARFWTCGFEVGNAQCEPMFTGGAGGGSPTHLTGTPTIDTGTVRTDSRSMKIDLSAGGQQIRLNALGGLEVPQYHRMYVRFQAFPSSGVAMLMSRPTGVQVQVNSSGQLAAYFNAASLSAVSATMSLNTWYRVEMMQAIRAAATDDIEFRLDGTSFFTSTSTGVERASTNSGNFDVGDSAARAGCVYFVDDMAINDNTGSDQNSWPGEGSVYNLLPVSDGAITTWTGGAGGTTNLFDALNNQPPTGTTAAADTNTTQIKNVVNNATATAQFNLESYDTAGIPAGAPILLCQAWQRIGNATAATARLMGCSGISNPAITEATASTPALTTTAEPANTWQTRVTLPVYNPSVTRATSPVIQIRNGVATTNERCADAMGMYVEAGPAPPILPPPDVNRAVWIPRWRP